MGKPTGKDESTQPLSASQIVPVTPKLPGGNIPKNDRSVWKNVVVGADDFATRPAKPRSRIWVILLLAGLGAGTALGLFYALSSSDSAKPAATAPPVVHDAATPLPADAALDAPVDAPVDAPIDAPADAATEDAAPIDAGVPAKPPAKKPLGKKKQPPKPKKKLH